MHLSLNTILEWFGRSPLRMWITTVILFWLTTLISFHSTIRPTIGDGPHYLIGTYSLIHDRDYDITNNYDIEQHRSWYAYPLDTHLLEIHGKQYPLHDIGLSLILLPGFAIFGVMGALFTIYAIVAFGCVQLYALLRRVVPEQHAIRIWFLASFSLPIIGHAHHIFPDPVAFAIITTVVRLLWDLYDKYSVHDSAIVLLLLSILPWLHSRLAIFSMGLFCYFLWILYKTKRIQNSLLLLGIPFVTTIVYFIGIQALYNVSFGDYLNARSLEGNAFSLRNAEGFVGLLLDRSSGLFWYAPMYILSVSGIIALCFSKKQKAYFRPFLIVASVYYVIVSFFFEWHGGFAPPARFLMPIMALFVLGLGYVTHFLLTGRKFLFKLLAYLNVAFTIAALRNPFTLLPSLPNADTNQLISNLLPFGSTAQVLLPNLAHNENISTYVLAIGWMFLLSVLTLHVLSQDKH